MAPKVGLGRSLWAESLCGYGRNELKIVLWVRKLRREGRTEGFCDQNLNRAKTRPSVKMGPNPDPVWPPGSMEAAITAKSYRQMCEFQSENAITCQMLVLG